MNKKKDILANIVFILTFLLIYFILTKGKYIFGSTTDFSTQHYLIPEYFRSLFYETKDLIPDFAFNLGGGQNIYYFAYYGFLSPFILISYLFPKVEMLNYIIIITSLSVIISTSLLYFYLRKNNYNFKTCFLVAFLFLCSAPLTFHAHRHVMFINYLPFLIMAMYGIDKYFSKNKIWLLTISLALIIFTNYYFSVSSLIFLFIFTIYKYLKINQSIKGFISNNIKLILSFVISIMMGAIIIIPTLYALLNGRIEGNSSVSFISLITPNMYLLYQPYSMGLTLISLISLLYLAVKGDKGNKFLSIIVLLISIFPIFNYILNGFLYIDGKCLIPFIPITLIIVAEFLNKIMITKRNYKQIILIGYIVLSAFTCSLIANFKDTLIPINSIKDDSNLIDYIVDNDNSFYRINNYALDGRGINNVSNIKEYKTTLYLSTFNKNYNKLYFDIFNNPMPHRNKSMMAPTNNILFQIFMGEKYIVTDQELSLGYQLIKKEDNLKIYENELALPIGYASKNIMSEKEFNALTYPNNIINMLKNIVVNSNEINNNLIKINKIDLDYSITSLSNIEYNKENNLYVINAKKNAKLTINIKEDMKNKILFIRFKNFYNAECGMPELLIKINNVKNKLTCKSWKYYNNNTTFDYVITDVYNLDITLEKGTYKLGEFEAYILDYNNIKNIKSEIDEFIFDKDKTKGDKIVGSINVREDSYFTFSIPYDKGFNIYVDKVKIDYEEVNKGFIGFKIKKGRHDIVMEYKAPYKNEGLIISILGVLCLLYIDLIRKNKRVSIDK